MGRLPPRGNHLIVDLPHESTKLTTPKMPTPEERPDLYDSFDFPDRPPGWKSGIKFVESEAIIRRRAAVKAEAEKLAESDCQKTGK
jgi:hypothetical protein